MINTIKFDTKDNEKPEDYVVTLGSHLQQFPIEDILRADYLQEKVNSKFKI